ncbi:MAG: hypothetical protein WAW63_04260 [Candidatus Saccharimonadales bacterium]
MSPSRKKIIIVSAALLALLGGFAVAEKTGLIDVFHNIRPAAKDQAFNNSKKEVALDEAKNDSSTTDADSGSKGTDNSGQYTPPQDPENIKIDAKQEGSSVTISTRLTGYSDGTCTLLITNGSRSNTKTAQIVYSSQFSTCAGYSVPVSEFGTGTWSLKLLVTSGGTTTEKLASVEVR